MIVGDNEKGAVAKASIGKCIDNTNNARTSQVLPGLYSPDSLFVCQAETYNISSKSAVATNNDRPSMRRKA